jgi:uncharacterized protein
MHVLSKFIFCLLITTFFVVDTKAQQLDTVSKQLLQDFFQQSNGYVTSIKKFIHPKQKVAPIQLLSGGLIYFYQNVVSEQLQAGCTYEITCSQYIKLAIQKYGFIKGTFAGLHQFVKCAEGNHGNHLQFKINDNNKIINAISDENCR